MIITCPFCNQSCETDIEIAVGQRIQCPYCERKFEYAGVPRVSAQNSFCTACGSPVRAGASFCINCGHKIGSEVAPVPAPASSEATDEEPEGPQIDLSDDPIASVWRKLSVVRGIVLFAFVSNAASLIAVSRKAGTCDIATILSAILLVSAGIILIFAITRGHFWARILTWASAPLFVFAIGAARQDFDIFNTIALILCLIAAAILAMPSVRSLLKKLDAQSTTSRKMCFIFLALIVLSILALSMERGALSPDERKLLDFASDDMPKFLIFCGTALIGVISWLFGKIEGKAKGSSIDDVEVASSKMREVSCSKCGQVITVPDIDDNDLVACPSCGHEFYPFGYSKLSVLAFYSVLFIITAPLAVILGKQAVKDIKANRGLHGISRARTSVLLGWIVSPITCAIAANISWVLLFVIAEIVCGICWLKFVHNK